METILAESPARDESRAIHCKPDDDVLVRCCQPRRDRHGILSVVVRRAL